VFVITSSRRFAVHTPPMSNPRHARLFELIRQGNLADLAREKRLLTERNRTDEAAPAKEPETRGAA